MFGRLNLPQLNLVHKRAPEVPFLPASGSGFIVRLLQELTRGSKGKTHASTHVLEGMDILEGLPSPGWKA